MTTNEELKSLLIAMRNDLSEKLDTVYKDIKELVKENAARTKEISQVDKKVIDLEARNRILEDKVLSCENKIESLLNRERAKNIVLFKVKDTDVENDNLLKTVREIFQSAEVNLEEKEIVAARRLGRVAGSRPILVTLDSQDCKPAIFHKVKNFGKVNIGLSNDFSKEIRQRRSMEYKEFLNFKQLLVNQGKWSPSKADT